jgi:superoxide dismutase, Cu-Zn family
MKSVSTALLFLGLFAAVLIGTPSVSAQNVARAKAVINSCTDGSVVGTATLFETPSQEAVKDVTVLLLARGIAPGKHAVHIHEFGACTPCTAAGSHLDLGPFGNNAPVTANHPFHSGDLVNVSTDKSGNGFMTHVTSRVSLSESNLSIFDHDGASIIIHALPDAYCPDTSDPNCAGGGRIACGILERTN